MRLSRIELQHVRAGRNRSQQQRGAGYQVRVDCIRWNIELGGDEIDAKISKCESEWC